MVVLRNTRESLGANFVSTLGRQLGLRPIVGHAQPMPNSIQYVTEQRANEFDWFFQDPIASMKNIAVRFGLTLGFIACCAARLFGDVTVSEPVGGNNISADKALTSTNGPAFTPLGSIVITEAATTDFAAGTNQTLVLTAAKSVVA